MEAKQISNQSESPCMWRISRTKDSLITPELIKLMEKYPYGSQQNKKIGERVCFAAFCLGTITWYITEGSQWGKNDYLFWSIMVEPNFTSINDITASYLNDIEIRDGFSPIIYRVGRDINFKPCKLSEIRDDYKLQKFITEMTELEESDDDDDDNDDY